MLHTAMSDDGEGLERRNMRQILHVTVVGLQIWALFSVCVLMTQTRALGARSKICASWQFHSQAFDILDRAMLAELASLPMSLCTRPCFFRAVGRASRGYVELSVDVTRYAMTLGFHMLC